MKGFIVDLKRAKSEDIIAVVLTDKLIASYYRFYGARHSILQLGNLIDFEVEGEDSRFMPRLRGISQMNFSWLYDRNRLFIWQNFIKLFAPHLKDAVDLDSFYYELLLKAAQRWHKQNPKRIVCESYIALLRYEGRVHPTTKCYICEQELSNQIGLMVALKPAHPECIYSASLDRSMYEGLLESGETIYLDDAAVNLVYSVIMKGF